MKHESATANSFISVDVGETWGDLRDKIPEDARIVGVRTDHLIEEVKLVFYFCAGAAATQ